MKRLKNFLLSLIFYFSLIALSNQEELCPSGMRKLYLDEKTSNYFGSARSVPLSLLYSEGSGALWYNRKVLIEPRFEIHLKASLDSIKPVVYENETDFDGFTMVISKESQTIGSGVSNDLGYSGFTKSYIMEFDFNKDANEIDTDSYSFKYCDTYCSGNDNNKIFTGKITSQKYLREKTNNWDFRLVYEDKRLSVYSGPNEILYTYDVDLKEKFGSNTAYIGFTGYMKGNRRELEMMGTFICEEGFDLSKTTGKFFINGKESDTAVVKAGDAIKYVFSMYNTKGQIVPNCYNEKIWEYNLTVNINCILSATIDPKDEYSFLLSFVTCPEIGVHTFTITVDGKGDSPVIFFEVVPGDLNTIKFLGHDGELESITAVRDTENNLIVMKYGDDRGGDFLIKNDLTFTLDFQMYDQNLNPVDLGTDSSTILSMSGLSLTEGAGKLSMTKYKGHYQLVIVVNKPGTYTIGQNKYMSEGYQFIVTESGPNLETSSCTMEGFQNSPSLYSAQKINYSCYFKDFNGNIINIESFIKSGYVFSCEVVKTSPETRVFKIEPTNHEDHYVCEYDINEMGDYTVYGYINQYGVESKTQIKGTIKNFKVNAYPRTLSGSKVFNPNNRVWMDIETATFNYKPNESRLLTALDLADFDNKTLISSVGYYPEDFDINSVKAVLTSSHDSNYEFAPLVPKLYSISGKEYIGIFTEEHPDKIIKKSSFDYQITVTFNGVTKVLNMKYVFQVSTPIGSFTTCFHDLDISKTDITMNNLNSNGEIQLKNGDKDVAIGTIKLKTTDGYLYNYDIGSSYIKVALDKDNDYSYFYVKQNSVLGTYTIYATTVYKFESILNVYINDEKVSGDGYKIKSVSVPACYLMPTNPNIFQISNNNYKLISANVENNLNFDFQLYDKEKNLLFEPDFNSTGSEISVGSKQTGLTSCRVSYNGEKNVYTFYDTIEAPAGTFIWVFNLKQCGKYYFSYVKSTGPVNRETSFYKVVNSNIIIGQTGFFEVTLRDSKGTNIGLNDGRLDEAKKYLTLFAGENILSFDSITSSLSLRYKYTFNKVGNYKVTVKYEEEIILGLSNEEETINVSYEQIDINNSKMDVLLDKSINMGTSSTITIDNTVQIPVFKYSLFDSKGNKITNYDKENTLITCTMNRNGVKWDLVANKKDNYINFSFDSDTKEIFPHLGRGEYSLILTVGEKQINYKLVLLGEEGNEDVSLLPEYDLSKTVCGLTHLYLMAGQEVTVMIEFRASDGLRWNKEVDTSLLEFANSQKLVEDDLKIVSQKGSKRGKLIIGITQNKVTPKDKDNEISIKYNGETITMTLLLTVTCGLFDSIEYVSGRRDGTVIDLPVLKFKPFDKHHNIYTGFFNSDNSVIFKSLVFGKSKEGITFSSNTWVNSDDETLNFQYITKQPTTIYISSYFFGDNNYNNFSYIIKNGPIDSEKTTVEISSKGGKTAGSEFTLSIIPKDKYSNDYENLSTEDLSKFKVYYETKDNKKIDITDKCLLEQSTNSFNCKTKITTSGTNNFKVLFKEEENDKETEIYFPESSVNIKEGNIEYKKSTITIGGEEMLSGAKMTVDATTIPSFEMAFHDDYGNVITDEYEISGQEITANLEGTDIKFCVTNDNDKKIITVCPSVNGDDNMNKWNYITNGEYTIVINQGDGQEISYILDVKGKYTDGSSKELDLTKTIFSSNYLELTAGKDEEVLMELYAVDNLRKNYWYPNPNDNIKVTFNKDSDKCKYSVKNGKLPGQYKIKVSCNKKTEDNDKNSFIIEIEGKPMNQNIDFTVKSGPANYLEILDKNKFTSSPEHYTFKTNPTNDENTSFTFVLYDRYRNTITNPMISELNLEISSSEFGTDTSIYSLIYDKTNNYYKFTDFIKKAVTKHTWTVTCKDNAMKYFIIYTKQPGEPNGDKSEFTLDKHDILAHGTSYIEITLRDRLNAEITDKDKLLSIKDNIKVIGTRNDRRNVEYFFDSVTDESKLKYVLEYELEGDFEIEVKLNENYSINSLNNKLKVEYERYSIEKNQLKIVDQGKETIMTNSYQTNINNQGDLVSFKYYLYTDKGESIDDYDKNIPISGKMTLNENIWNLEVEKNDDYIELKYPTFMKKEFNSLPGGKYTLTVKFDGQEMKYILYLLGDKGSQDASASSSYDLTKTVFDKTQINGIAGEKYDLILEFRASDGLRWNYEPNLNSFSFSNSYKLSPKDLRTEVKLGEKKGQAVISIIQNKATKDKTDNILTIKYEEKAVLITVSLNIKCGPINKLVYVSGATDGTVINPPTVLFKGYDAYDNVFTDLVGTSNTNTLKALTNGKNSKGENLICNVSSDEDYIYVQYKSIESTGVTITSKYLNDTIKYKITSGPFDIERSYGHIINKEIGQVNIEYILEIVPKDKYFNGVDNISKNDLNNYNIYYEIVGKPYPKTIITSKCSLNINYDGPDNFTCPSVITTAGNIYYHIEYNGHEIDCSNCYFYISEGTVDMNKISIEYKNKEIELSKTDNNVIQVNTIPELEVTFHDTYGNEITDMTVIENINLKAEISGSDVYLCIINKQNKKIITVCNKNEEDDNINKWYYSTNSKDHLLTITTDKSLIKYKIEFTGGSAEGSSGKMDSCMTYFNPMNLKMTAGKEMVFHMELRDSNGQRKNYFYPDVNKVVSLSFAKDADSCKYRIEESSTIGIYDIFVICNKKQDSNLITVKMEDSTKTTVIEGGVEEREETKSIIENKSFDSYMEATSWGEEDDWKVEEITKNEGAGTSETLYFGTNQMAIDYAKANGIKTEIIKSVNDATIYNDKGIGSKSGVNIAANWENLHTFNLITLDGNLVINTHIRGSIYANGDVTGNGYGIDDTYDNGVPIKTTSYVKGSCQLDGLWGRGGVGQFKDRKKPLTDSTEDIKKYWNSVVEELKSRGMVKIVKNSEDLRDNYLKYTSYSSPGSDSAIRVNDDTLIYLYEGTADFEITNWYSFLGVLIAPNAKIIVPYCNWCGTIIAKTMEVYGEAHCWTPKLETKYTITSSSTTYSVRRIRFEKIKKMVNTTKEVERIKKCLDMKTIPFKVLSSDPVKSVLYNIYGQEITSYDLGSVDVDGCCKFKQILYDNYGNIVTPYDYSIDRNDYKISLLEGKNKGTYSFIVDGKTNGEIIITVYSTITGSYEIQNNLFEQKKCKVDFISGKITPGNCKIEVEDSEVKVGEQTRIIVTPYDQYENQIDGNNYLEENPFDLYYYDNGNKIMITDYDIEEKNGQNVIVYYYTFEKTDNFIISGDIDGKPINCVTCSIVTQASDIDFSNTKIIRYDSSTNSFINLVDGVIEKNTKEDPIYRLYFRDTYGNDITEISSELVPNYKVYLHNKNDGTDYYLKSNIQEDEDMQSYVEFIKPDDKYEKLVGGKYDLIITDGETSITRTITIAGDGNDSGASNKEPKIDNTFINSENLYFEAGGKGEMFIELRTEDNLRANTWEDYQIEIKSCDPNDKTFTYNTEKSGTAGVYYVTLSTNMTTTSGTICPLKIYINGEEVPGLHPEIKVTPGTIHRSEIVDIYYKDINKYELIDGNSNTEYVFEVVSYDKYGNKLETDQEVVGIKVSTLGEFADITSTSTSTGSRKYIVKVPKASIYTVTSNINNKEGNTYLINDVTFKVTPGKIDPKKTVVQETSGQIEAGGNPSITIYSFDVNGNPIKGEDFKNDYLVSFIDEYGNEFDTDWHIDPQDDTHVTFTSNDMITLAGEIRTIVTYKDTQETIPTPDINIEIIPSVPDLGSSVITIMDKEGNVRKYENGEDISINTKELLSFNISFYDDFNNMVNNFAGDFNIENAKFEGNYMDTIYYDIIKNKDHYTLDFSSNIEYVDIYSHLVSGDSYLLSFDITTSDGEIINYSYPVTIVTDINDNGYGNGRISVNMSELIGPKKVVQPAGSFITSQLEFKTEGGWLYSRDVDTAQVLVETVEEDATFKYEVSKTGENNGIYTLTYYSEIAGENTMNVYYDDPVDGEIKLVGSIDIDITPSPEISSEHTEIIRMPEREIEPSDYIDIEFKLVDEFGNIIKNKDDVINNGYLIITNNGKDITYKTSQSLLGNGETYKVSIPPQYPPRKMEINIIYDDGKNTYTLLPTDITTRIVSEPSYSSTDIISSNLNKIKVGEQLDMHLKVYDKKGVCLDSPDFSSSYEVTVFGPTESTSKLLTKTYKVEKSYNPLIDCQNEYQIVLNDDDVYTEVGTYNIKVTANGETIGNYIQTCETTGYNIKGFSLEFNNKAQVWSSWTSVETPVTDKIGFTITGSDIYGNVVNNPLIDDINMTVTKVDGQPVDFDFKKTEDINGKLKVDLEVHDIGEISTHLFYKGEEIKNINGIEDKQISFNFVTGKCSHANFTDFDISSLSFTSVNEPSSFKITCYDSKGYRIYDGGEEFQAYGNIIIGDTKTTFPTEIVDNNDGTYEVRFVPPLAGQYVVNVLLNEEKYGDEIAFPIKLNPCDKDNPFLCPNIKKCVKNRIDCLEPANDCPPSTPFYCKANNIQTCVKSQTDCDCPEGYHKCSWMHYCVPGKEDDQTMCPTPLSSKKLCLFQKEKGYDTLFKDGLCRNSTIFHEPTQVVCPIGQVLCGDLTCRDSYKECEEYPKCPIIKCIDQSCVNDIKYCPSTIYCNNPDDMVCPDGSCVENEIYCNPLPVCTGEYSFRCANNMCARSSENCPKSTACGHGKMLCSDSICRERCE